MSNKRKFKPVYRLENWNIQFADGDLDAPPHERRLQLCGAIYGHDLFGDGHRITTATIESIVDLVAKTRTGSVYKLCEPNRDLVAFMEVEYPGWDWRNPMAIGPRRSEAKKANTP